MGTQTITASVTLIPSGHMDVTNITADSTYGPTRAYADASNTTYSRYTFSSATTGYVYYTFDTSSIPADATITSISARGKARVNNTSRVTNTGMQLYSGTTAKGNSTAFAMTTASTQNLSPGAASTWTRANLNDLRIRIVGTGSGNSTKRFDFYGADVTIGYSYTVTTYDVTISNSSTATVTADNTTPIAGDTVKVTASTLSGITVTDNNTDVTSQFIEVHGGTIAAVPSSSANTGFTITDLNNAYHGSDNTNYARLDLGGGASGTLYLNFGDLGIPSGAAISSVSCQLTYEYNRNNSSSGYTGSCQMYANTTAKGSSSTLVSAGGTAVAKTTIDLTVGSWSASDFSNPRLYITATNNASSTHRYLYIYGATFTVVYTLSGSIYVYTITNIQANHAIVVTGSASTAKIYYKNNGSWVAASKVYKKVSGSWVEQSDLTTVFDSNTNYVKG